MKKRVVRAEEFEVVDDLGHVRMRIGLSADEHPFFSMLDADGSVRARFGVQADGAAGLAIADDNGKVRATFGLSSDGSASLAFGDKNGRIRAKFGLGSDASPTMGVDVEDGELEHRHKLTPYNGESLMGVVEKTFLRGKKIYDGHQEAQEAQNQLGKGKFIYGGGSSQPQHLYTL